MKKIVRCVVSLVLMVCIAASSLFITAPTAEASSYSYETILQAQKYLCSLGYMTDINGDLDKSTRKQLQYFQRDANLVQTGEPDSPTMDRLQKRSAAANKNNKHVGTMLCFNGDYRLLERKSNGSRVKILNELLEYLGYEHDKGSSFGKKTENGVRAFQADFVREHPVDGKAGPYTLSRLEVVYGLVMGGSYTVPSLIKYVNKHHKLPDM